MNRIEFMKSLEGLLGDISVEERNDALEYYNDYFDEAGGENEADVIRDLGSPEKVAARIKSGLEGEENGEYSETGYKDVKFEEKEELIKKQTSKTLNERNNNILKAILIIVAICVFAPVVFPIVFAAIVTVLSIVLAIFIIGIALMLCGIVFIVVGILQAISATPLAFLFGGIGLICFALGLIIEVGVVKLSFKVIPKVFNGAINLIRKPFHRRKVVL